MKIEKALELLQKTEENKAIQNFIAQGNSRYILFNVNEPIANFPNFTENLDSRLMSIAYTYLSIGCSISERGNLKDASVPLEKAASVLEYVHFPMENRNVHSNYAQLTSALAYYASFQYSKAFILLKTIEFENKASVLVSSLLKKDFNRLQTELNSVLLSEEYNDQNLEELEDDLEINYRIYTKLIARSIASLLEFMLSGNENELNRCKEVLSDLLELSSIELEPSIWWITRLLIIIIDGHELSSLWNVLPTKIPDDSNLLDEYIRSLAFGTPNITELFVSQIASLNKVLASDGATVGLPTSSGKTRVAEIAILQNLIDNPDSITLYLAPFRSLAFEIEESLSETFNPIGHHVSHLYGGGQFNKIDRNLIDESRIIIATPEKAKAILRADEDISARIKLIIIDEGHLLGASQRYTTNEFFIEELRVEIAQNHGKIVLLSAVLPNTKEISKWISSSEDNVVESKWRPSSQRFGKLEWTGRGVNIAWESLATPAPFNRDFVELYKIQRPRSVISFPQNKKDAVALTALKLTSLGSVLIFVGRKNMVKSQAKSMVTAMSLTEKLNHEWSNTQDWELFDLACEEAYGENSEILNFASYGIICHDAGLPTEVRSTMEKLMRNGNPRIIISTSTLAQGVNIGVSSVIIANVYIGIGATPIDKKDFWNIAGRAGRAFVDSEGKILYALDLTKAEWQIEKDQKLVRDYFDSSKMEDATSGILSLVNKIFDIASKCDINDQLLLELISENDYSAFVDEEGNDYSEFVENRFDLIDDTLLSLNYKFESYLDFDSSEWVDDFFRKSLAFIQAENSPKYDSEKVISFFSSRNKGVIKMAGDPANWKSYVSSGIPLKSSLIIEENIDDIITSLNDFQTSDGGIDDYVQFLHRTEEITRKFPSEHFKNEFLDKDIDLVRSLWMSGASMTNILEASEQGLVICTAYFGFTLPWAINAIARKLQDLDYIDESEIYSELAMLTELGLPNYKAAKLYLAGVKSRFGATELSEKLSFSTDLQLWKLTHFIIENFDSLISKCSSLTARWLETLKRNESLKVRETQTIVNMRYDNDDLSTADRVFLKEEDGQMYICNSNYSFTGKASISNPALAKAANNLGVYFEYDWMEEKWEMKVRNPRIFVEN